MDYIIRPVGKKILHLVVQEEFFYRWQKVGDTHGGLKDTEIAHLLLLHFENTISTASWSGPHCIRCDSPLPLYCANCKQVPVRDIITAVKSLSSQHSDLFELNEQTESASVVSHSDFSTSAGKSENVQSVFGSEVSDGNADFSSDGDSLGKVSEDIGEADQHHHDHFDSSEEFSICKPTKRDVKTGAGTAAFGCRFCDARFRHQGRLTVHLKRYHGEDSFHTFPCEHCPAKYTFKRNLKAHWKKHHRAKSKISECKLCGKSFRRNICLRQHLQKHNKANNFPAADDLISNKTQEKKFINNKQNATESIKGIQCEKLYKCNFCEKSFPSSVLLKCHSTKHSGMKPYACSICGFHFRLSGHLKVHLRTHTGERPFLCEQCGMSFVSSSTLTVHKLRHSGVKRFVCKDCGTAFLRAADLQIHARKHTGDRPYLCQRCGKAYATISSLTRHRRIHTENKSYTCLVCKSIFFNINSYRIHKRQHKLECFTCDHCGKAFDQRSRYMYHMRSHTGYRPHKCPHCSKAFARQSDLNVHVRSHTGERPYTCKECGKGFSVSGNLLRHMVIHSGQKPYKCEVCDAAFADASTCRQHIQKHSGEKPYKCKQCQASFTQSGSLSTHIKKKHVEGKGSD